MHWLWIAVLALLLGFVNAWITPFITAAIPASVQQNKWVATFINGAIILFAVFVAVFILSAVAGRKVVSA